MAILKFLYTLNTLKRPSHVTIGVTNHVTCDKKGKILRQSLRINRDILVKNIQRDAS